MDAIEDRNGQISTVSQKKKLDCPRKPRKMKAKKSAKKEKKEIGTDYKKL